MGSVAVNVSGFSAGEAVDSFLQLGEFSGYCVVVVEQVPALFSALVVTRAPVALVGEADGTVDLGVITASAQEANHPFRATHPVEGALTVNTTGFIFEGASLV
jgi:hypothetical protein